MPTSPRHVVVTGASSGIGEAIAREFASRGDRVTLMARRRELLEKLAAEIGHGARAYPFDFSDPSKATAWIDDVGPIDVLVINAGIENTGPAIEADVDEAMRVLRTNLLTPLLIVRAVAPMMVARGQGTIVNVASVAAMSAVPKQAWYGASKAGFGSFSETVRSELRHTGVHLLTVYPGPVTTPMGEAAYAKFGGRKGMAGLMPEGKPAALARLVYRGVARRKKRIVYPAFYWLNWYMPWLARFLFDLVRI